MQDEVPRPIPGHLRSANAADLLDQALEFRRAYGAYPSTWPEFVTGLGHLGRAASAEKLRIADAVAATKDPKHWQQWKRDHQTLAGG